MGARLRYFLDRASAGFGNRTMGHGGKLPFGVALLRELNFQCGLNEGELEWVLILDVWRNGYLMSWGHLMATI